jgi:hypothetical protein
MKPPLVLYVFVKNSRNSRCWPSTTVETVLVALRMPSSRACSACIASRSSAFAGRKSTWVRNRSRQDVVSMHLNAGQRGLPQPCGALSRIHQQYTVMQMRGDARCLTEPADCTPMRACLKVCGGAQ